MFVRAGSGGHPSSPPPPERRRRVRPCGIRGHPSSPPPGTSPSPSPSPSRSFARAPGDIHRRLPPGPRHHRRLCRHVRSRGLRGTSVVASPRDLAITVAFAVTFVRAGSRDIHRRLPRDLAVAVAVAIAFIRSGPCRTGSGVRHTREKRVMQTRKMSQVVIYRISSRVMLILI
ncbi:hypothetical protein PVAP13_3KG029282 [Panicum virgatum]|uniref:Uncharacterized protein n=1 Tax=Panicum virgatum TaxID=38727 RepID=A0A8T0UK30_PANVG|nr:hypothetical protein PVAP13_3KG029282 [Panicum virgatum]